MNHLSAGKLKSCHQNPWWNSQRKKNSQHGQNLLFFKILFQFFRWFQSAVVNALQTAGVSDPATGQESPGWRQVGSGDRLRNRVGLLVPECLIEGQES